MWRQFANQQNEIATSEDLRLVLRSPSFPERWLPDAFEFFAQPGSRGFTVVFDRGNRRSDVVFTRGREQYDASGVLGDCLGEKNARDFCAIGGRASGSLAPAAPGRRIQSEMIDELC
jgi:hypothetical protein